MTKGVRMGSYVRIYYRVPGKPGATEQDILYEGKIVDKRVGGQDRESYVELENCMELDSEDRLIELTKRKRLSDAFIEHCKVIEKRETPPEPAPTPVEQTTLGASEEQGGMMGGMMPGMMGGMMPGMMQGGMMGQMPGVMPGMMQGEMPGSTAPEGMMQSGMPGSMQGGMPGSMQGGMTGGMPGMMPGAMQGGMPSMMPGQQQGMMMMPNGMMMMPNGMQQGMQQGMMMMPNGMMMMPMGMQMMPMNQMGQMGMMNMGAGMAALPDSAGAGIVDMTDAANAASNSAASILDVTGTSVQSSGSAPAKLPKAQKHSRRSEQSENLDDVEVGTLIIVKYQHPSMGQIKYEGVLIEKQLDGTSHDSFIQLQDCKQLSATGKIKEREDSKKLMSAFINLVRLVKPGQEATVNYGEGEALPAAGVAEEGASSRAKGHSRSRSRRKKS